MRVPNIELAQVTEEKITRYLLNPAHPVGGGKALFFLRSGFTLAGWEVLAQALLHHAGANDVVQSEQTQYGVRYVVDGPLTAPDGTVLNVRSAWYIDSDGGPTRFVTAHPLPKR